MKMVGPKRHFLPLLLLLSVSALFFFSHYHSSLPLSFPPNSYPNFTLAQKNLNPEFSNFTLIIKVLAFNRLDSLSRCLRSLAKADYLSDRVHLHVYIDHFGQDDGRLKLNASHRILEFVNDFNWGFGEKFVHYRTGNVGLQAQWLEAWWPSSDNEFAFVVEDDLEVSPLYYKFLKSLIVNYYYNVTNYSPSIYGASLQRPRFVPGKHGNKIKLDGRTRLFLYQLVGTWGQLLFPKPWKEFRLWYDRHKAMGIKPLLEGMVTTGWYKKMGERIWTPWFIKFIHSRGYFNIYTKFLHERALSVSHRDAGVNYGKTAGPDSHLLDHSSLDYDLFEMQPLSDLTWYDFCFREVIPERLIKSYDELRSVLHSIQQNNTIILVSLFGVSESTTRNLLCHFEKQNVWNYIFLGPEVDFVFDLARRGHPVIDADLFLRTIKASYKMMAFRGFIEEPIKEVLAKIYLIKTCIEYGYNILTVDGNVIFANNDSFLESNPTNDFYIGQNLELFFVRSSSSAQKIWVSNVVPKVEALLKSVSRGSSMRESKSFRHLMAELLENSGARMNWIDEMSFGMNIGDDNATSSLRNGKKMVFWSAGISEDLIQKRLEELGMWIVDGDYSCKAVVCNRS